MIVECKKEMTLSNILCKWIVSFLRLTMVRMSGLCSNGKNYMIG